MRKITHIGIVVCMVLAMSGADAQEYIKSVGFSPNSSSLIRSVSSTSWVYHACSNHLSSFSLMNSTGSTHSAISQLPFWVSDMVVRNNNVFFCGTKNSHFFGYFSLNGFPNTTVNTVTVPDLKPVDNIEVFYYGGNVRHVVLTGKYGDNDSNCIIDAMQSYPFTGEWDLTIATNTNVDIVYHDVAVTDNYVFASGQESNSTDGYIVAFQKRQMLLGGFLYNPGVYIKTAYPAYGNILLKEGVGDTVYAVYKNSSNEFTVEAFVAGSSINVVAYRRFSISNFSNSIIADINYKSVDRIIEILMTWKDVGVDNSVIWHISPSQLISGGVVYGHNFSGHKLHSITTNNGIIENTLASGWAVPGDFMRQYAISAFSMAECTLFLEVESNSISCRSVKGPFYISPTVITLYPDEETKIVTNTSTTTLCPSKDDE